MLIVCFYDKIITTHFCENLNFHNFFIYNFLFLDIFENVKYINKPKLMQINISYIGIKFVKKH